MKSSEIKIGETYLFVATDSPTRKHLEGQPFEVTEKRRVWRRVKGKRANVYRFFDQLGHAARAEELEPINVDNMAMTFSREIFEKWQEGPVVDEPKQYTNGGWDIDNQKNDLPF